MRQVLSRQVLGKGMLTAAAASSLLSIATGAAYAYPGATAEAAHSPGVLSGNSVSVPITFAPNVCGNSVDGGAALNPAMGNTCATTTGSHVSRDTYEHYLSPERAEAFERYLDEERRGRHALPDGGRREERGYGEQRHPAPRHAAPHHEAPRHEAPWHAAPHHEAPRHAAPRHEERRAESGYGDAAQECDDHPRHEAGHPHPAPPAPPRAAPRPAPERPAPRPHPKPAPAPERPAQAPVPLPAPEPFPTPAEEAPAPLPAPAPAGEAPPVTLPAPAPPAPRPPHGSRPVGHPAVAQELAATGAGRPGAAAALASALILGGAISYRRSRSA
ncbi:chaplin [Streptomyces goshikiensis]|uniref:chaplin n=1 Tax=Streptomyces goshikiensis TaxID=1942 RepID=UPI0036AEBF9F